VPDRLSFPYIITVPELNFTSVVSEGMFMLPCRSGPQQAGGGADSPRQPQDAEFRLLELQEATRCMKQAMKALGAEDGGVGEIAALAEADINI